MRPRRQLDVSELLAGLAPTQLQAAVVAEEVWHVEELRDELLHVRRVLQAVLPRLCDGVEEAVSVVQLAAL